ncbi:glycosyltransferase family 2 protein [Agromyces larvae]|uniref:Glycosyltransferase family 2 protein n=1 Tax=Agromyces larvae TaxID=2929802 RepID=A0ABY4C235_9MICO|nr:glycosyltransferase family 2 protein [Agromyces larvae]UOE44507.1 glycosyltransferase family 2 protein [Agromyces larvae]
MTGVRVSVALGTHNGARFLEAQLRSILAQTRAVDEIVLSDDASSDGTVELAERLVAEHRGSGGAAPDLVVLRNDPPLGVTANFEQALRSATGDLIALSDQDDIWRADRIERAVEVFDARPGLQLVASGARLVDDQGEPIGATLFGTLGLEGTTLERIRVGAAFEELLKRNLLTGATMMVRRSLVEAASPFPPTWVHDEWLAVVASVIGGIAVIDDELIDYRQHGGNQIGVTALELTGKIGRLRAPRTERNVRLRARAADLARRLPAIASDRADLAEVVADKLVHEQVRSAYPRSRFGRIVPVLREARTGRYGRYGLGAQDILRDLVQPV